MTTVFYKPGKTMRGDRYWDNEEIAQLVAASIGGDVRVLEGERWAVVYP